jgi:hypothetical protein
MTYAAKFSRFAAYPKQGCEKGVPELVAYKAKGPARNRGRASLSD